MISGDGKWLPEESDCAVRHFSAIGYPLMSFTSEVVMFIHHSMTQCLIGVNNRFCILRCYLTFILLYDNLERCGLKLPNQLTL